MKEKLIALFENTIKDDNLHDVVALVGDYLLDMPIISELNSWYKLTKNFQLHRLEKKMCKFILNIEDTNSAEREKFITEYTDKNKEDGCEALLNVLDRLDNVNKVDVLANLIKAKIRGCISIENFIRLTIILDRIPYSDLGDLSKYTESCYEDGSTDVLLSAGVLTRAFLDANGSNQDCLNLDKYRLNFLGKILLKYGYDYNTGK